MPQCSQILEAARRLVDLFDLKDITRTCIRQEPEQLGVSPLRAALVLDAVGRNVETVLSPMPARAGSKFSAPHPTPVGSPMSGD